MNKTNYSYALKCFAYAAVIYLSPLQPLMAQAQQANVTVIQKATLQSVVRNLEQKHVQPKAIDDNFSKVIWEKYLRNLDPNKEIFLQSDLQQLKKYELNIDDELKAGQTDFFAAAYQVYQQRLNLAAAAYRKILEKPFDFKKDESIELNGEFRDFAINQKALTRSWQKKAKYLVLKKMFDLDRSKMNSVSLEKDARAKVSKWLSNTFKNLTSSFARDEKFSQYINTITYEIDPHTSYYAPIQAKNVKDQMAKRYYGVGMELQDKEGDVFVKALRPGGMAIKSGMVDVNDRILSISNPEGQMVDVAGIPITEVVNLIRGDKDTEVSLGLLKINGQEKTVSLQRAEIKDEEGRARSAVIEKDGQKLGYIYLQEFYMDMVNPNGIRSADDVQKEIFKLKAENVKGIIFDLRGNGGGSLDEVVKMTGYFIGPGPKVQIKDSKELKIHTTNRPALFDGPLVVMVNEQSASASEIFAAAIQDYNRGIIVGSPATYGKGTAQATLPMGKMGDKSKGLPNVSYGSLQLTQHHFYRVNGASTQLKGVHSDVVFPGKLAYLKIKEKDNLTALAWDSIPAAGYTEYNRETAWTKVLNLAKATADELSTFKVIDENSKLLAQRQLDPVSLNRVKFVRQQEMLQTYAKKIEDALQLHELKTIKVSGTLEEGSGNEWYKKWTEGLSTDLYLNRSLDVLNRMIQVK